MKNESYMQTLDSLRHVRKMAQKLSKMPVACLKVDSEDAADAEYVTEWLDIVLCRICNHPEVLMPCFDEHFSELQQFHWFMEKAARQAAALRRGLFLRMIEKPLFAEKAWDGLDSAESFLESFLSENVCLRKRWCR